jgi:uncharacterized membrane protein YdfJ with MMPL/SSD domain
MSDNGADVRIMVSMEPQDNGVKAILEEIRDLLDKINGSVVTYGESMKNLNVKLKSTANEQDKANKSITNAMSSVRVASKDIWSLAYALNRLNAYVFGNNETVQKFVETLIALGSVLRILAIIQSVLNNLQAMQGIVKALTLVYQFFNTTVAQSAFWMSILTFGAAIAAGVAMWAIAQSTVPKSYATGGTVPATGIYMLHKGEKVSENGPDYSQININVTAGPINTREDVGNLFKEMSINMAKERRRRGQ